MRWRIRNQLLLPLLLLLLGVVGGSIWTGLASVQRVRRQIETRIGQVARNLSEESNYALSVNVLLQMKRLSGADYVVVPPQGQPLTTLPAVPQPLPPAETVSDHWQSVRLGPPLRIAGQTYLCGGVRLQGPRRSGETLYILYPQTLWRDALWEAVGPVVLLGGGVGLAAVALTLGLARSLGRRLHELERRTRLIAAGDFSPMPLPARNDEIRDLTASVNDMAQTLAQYQQTVQRTERLRLLDQVGGGLAHQLRNGLTGARLALQLYLQENAGAGDQVPLEVALRQITLLEAHLKRFLDLGRDGTQPRIACPLADLVQEAVDLLGPKCRHAGITLYWDKPSAAPAVWGDPAQLGQVILNLLSNALEAAGPGGAVTVDVGEGDKPWLEVWDTGPGPRPEIAARMFEPFVTGKPEGVGLGLAVANQVAQAHGGRLTWQRRDSRTCFRLEFDVPQEAPLEVQTTGNP
jgi:signal transduction histidine kinase